MSKLIPGVEVSRHYVQGVWYSCKAEGMMEGTYCPLCVLQNVCEQSGNDLVGEVLTFVDAVLPEGAQNKATKDSLKRMIWLGFHRFREDASAFIGDGESMEVDGTKKSSTMSVKF